MLSPDRKKLYFENRFLRWDLRLTSFWNVFRGLGRWFSSVSSMPRTHVNNSWVQCTHCIPALGRWGQLEPWGLLQPCLCAEFLASERPLLKKIGQLLWNIQGHSFTGFHTHAPTQINKCTPAQKVTWITIQYFTVKMSGSRYRRGTGWDKLLFRIVSFLMTGHYFTTWHPRTNCKNSEIVVENKRSLFSWPKL